MCVVYMIFVYLFVVLHTNDLNMILICFMSLFKVQKSAKVKRKKEKEMDVDGNKRKKRKQLQPETPEITFAEMAGLELLKDVSLSIAVIVIIPQDMAEKPYQFYSVSSHFCIAHNIYFLG